MTSAYDPSDDLERLRVQSDVHAEIDGRAIDRASALLGPRSPIRVLDVGCGDGSVTASRFGAGGFETTGIDVSEAAISRARALYPGEGLTFRTADLFDTSGSFDLVWCSQFLQHAGDPRAALAKLWSLLSPGGVLVCRNSDDGLDVTYPPVPGFQEVIDATGRLRGASDRRIGRKLHHLFQTALTPRPSHTHIAFEVVSNLEKSPEQNAAVLHVRHGFRAEAVRRHLRLGGGPPTDGAGDDMTPETVQGVLARACDAIVNDPATLSFTVQFVATAQKPHTP